MQLGKVEALAIAEYGAIASSISVVAMTSKGDFFPLFTPKEEVVAGSIGQFSHIGDAVYFSYAYSDVGVSSGVSSAVMRVNSNGLVEKVATLEGVRVEGSESHDVDQNSGISFRSGDAVNWRGNYVVAGNAPVSSFATVQQLFSVGADGSVDQLTDFVSELTDILPRFGILDGDLIFSSSWRTEGQLWSVSDLTAEPELLSVSSSVFSLHLSQLADLRIHNGVIYLVSEYQTTPELWVYEGGSGREVFASDSIDRFQLFDLGERLYLAGSVQGQYGEDAVVAFEVLEDGELLEIRSATVRSNAPSGYGTEMVIAEGEVYIRDFGELWHISGQHAKDSQLEIMGREFIGVPFRPEFLSGSDAGLFFVTEGLKPKSDGGYETVGRELHSYTKDGGLVRLTGVGTQGNEVGRIQEFEIFSAKVSRIQYGGKQSDALNGTRQGDLIDAGRGADEVHGRGGADIIFGGTGADLLRGGSGNDDISGGSGKDRVFGDKGNDNIQGGGRRDFLTGGGGDDTIFGGGGGDKLIGGAGDDFIYGNEGADTLKSGSGSNRMNGGSGADVFVVSHRAESVWIEDFSAEDTLILNERLWGGELTSEQVLDRFSRARSGDLIFDFDNGTQVVLSDAADLFV